MTLNLAVRTEYSLRHSYGKIADVIAHCGGPALAIVDRNGTWGHAPFMKACKKNNIKPVFGVELAVTRKLRDRKSPKNFMRFLARNDAGLSEIYQLVTLATDQFYYMPLLTPADVLHLSDDVAVLSGPLPDVEAFKGAHANFYAELRPDARFDMVAVAKKLNWPLVASADNYFNNPEDMPAYEILVDDIPRTRNTTPQHIITQEELALIWPQPEVDIALHNSEKLLKECNANLPQAEMVKPECEFTLKQLCVKGAKAKACDLKRPEYAARLKRELDLIEEKKFADYFILIWDMITYAKKHMLVGPARGSSCGSLVCYLLDITTIDPMPYELLFERFISVERADLPDIDIDFPDIKRDKVFKYLIKKYGKDCVARLGTISHFNPKSCIGETAKRYSVPAFETEDLKNAIPERSKGDARANFCLSDTFNDLDVGKALIEKYPHMMMASRLEAHARHSGQHAAGMVVTQHPLSRYVSVDNKTGAIHADKKDADDLNLLKIDCLGLRTLSIIEDCLEQIDKPYQWIIDYPTDDQAALKVLNDGRFTGIFQFEGYALQSITRQMDVKDFNDVAAITALARPGPIHGGATTEFIKRKNGAEITYMPGCEAVTKDTLGTVVYQEQVMQIGRELGGLSWEDVSSLRKAMSKSLGEEFFNKYWSKFKAGAKERGVPEDEAKRVWDNICSFGSWAFNKSHAVAYGLVSYWCCALKAHHPLEFSAACLRHAKSDDQILKLLRELSVEGYDYEPFNAEQSDYNWSVINDKLVGGLIGVRGVGPKTARDILRRRKEGLELKPGQARLLWVAKTPYDDIWETETLWGHIKREPEKYKIKSALTEIGDITEDSAGEFVFIGKLKDKNLRDHNEIGNVQKRGGRRIEGQTLFLNLMFEDDSDNILASVNRFKYLKVGKAIVEEGVVDESWYLVKGKKRPGFRKIDIDRVRRLTRETV